MQKHDNSLRTLRQAALGLLGTFTALKGKPFELEFDTGDFRDRVHCVFHALDCLGAIGDEFWDNTRDFLGWGDDDYIRLSNQIIEGDPNLKVVRHLFNALMSVEMRAGWKHIRRAVQIMQQSL